MSTQILLTIDFPRVSVGRVLPETAFETVSARAAAPARPPDGGVQREPELRAVWKIQNDRLTLVWA
jgi:hypothetical protein